MPLFVEPSSVIVLNPSSVSQHALSRILAVLHTVFIALQATIELARPRAWIRSSRRLQIRAAENCLIGCMALNELCGYLDLTRQAVTKRLALLESANLIFTMSGARTYRTGVGSTGIIRMMMIIRGWLTVPGDHSPSPGGPIRATSRAQAGRCMRPSRIRLGAVRRSRRGGMILPAPADTCEPPCP